MGDEEKKYSQEYVTDLREENKSWRKKLQTLSDEFDQYKKDSEKATREAAEAAAKEDGKYKDLYEKEKTAREKLETEVNGLKDQIKSFKPLEESLEKFYEAEIEDIPEDQRELIPDLPVSEKLTWVKNAKKKGMLGNGTENGGDHKHKPPGENDAEKELFAKNPWSKEHRNLTKQGQLLRENRSLADRLKAAAGVN